MLPEKVYLGFETHGTPISGNAKYAAELCAMVGSPFFGVLYDPCNILNHGDDYREAFHTYKEHITHVHLKDGLVALDAKFRRVMLGEGQIDAHWVIEQLDAIGYAGDVALEYELESPEPETGMPQWYATIRELVKN